MKISSSNFLLKLFYFIFLLDSIKSIYLEEEKHHSKIKNNFVFGSCFIGRISDKFDIFDTIAENNPELYVWLGDAAYADNKIPDKNGDYFNYEFSKDLFHQSKTNPAYANFVKRTPMVGVWDDHDFCINDGNGYFKDKETCKTLYLDYIDERKDSPRRNPGRAIYASYSFGDLNSHKNFRIVLLDVRYNKTSYLMEKNPDMLGEDQWQWLENIFRESKETYIFIGSGTQIFPIDRMVTEAWYENSRIRLFEMIGKYRKSGVILMSGDIHTGQILRTPCELPSRDFRYLLKDFLFFSFFFLFLFLIYSILGFGYKLYEITSSGLSHYYPVGFLYDYILPNKYSYLPSVTDYNFGKISFDWGDKKENSLVNIELIDGDNNTRVKVPLKYNDLSYNENHINNSKCRDYVYSRFRHPRDLIKIYVENKKKLFDLIPFIGFGLFVVLLLFIIIYPIYKLLQFVLFLLSFVFKIFGRKEKIN